MMTYTVHITGFETYDGETVPRRIDHWDTFTIDPKKLDHRLRMLKPPREGRVHIVSQTPTKGK